MKICFIAVALLLSIVATATAKDNGCDKRLSKKKCVHTSSRWDGRAFITKYTNNCDTRVVAVFCHESQMLGGSSCGQDSIRPGRSTSWRSYNVTGKSRMEYVGSEDSNYDWICVQEAGINSDRFFL